MLSFYALCAKECLIRKAVKYVFAANRSESSRLHVLCVCYCRIEAWVVRNLWPRFSFICNSEGCKCHKESWGIPSISSACCQQKLKWNRKQLKNLPRDLAFIQHITQQALPVKVDQMTSPLVRIYNDLITTDVALHFATLFIVSHSLKFTLNEHQTCTLNVYLLPYFLRSVKKYTFMPSSSCVLLPSHRIIFWNNWQICMASGRKISPDKDPIIIYDFSLSVISRWRSCELLW